MVNRKDKTDKMRIRLDSKCKKNKKIKNQKKMMMMMMNRNTEL